MSIVKILYRFHLADGQVREYGVEIAGDTGRLLSAPAPHPQPWTKLEHKQCGHCPLKKETHPECPVALGLGSVADDFKGIKSFDKATVEVIATERTYKKELRVQEGLFGIFGLLMATSDCPYFNFLRPMARFHLPFSTMKDTIVRSVSFYLLRQYFVAKKGGKPDFELSDLQKLYADLEVVNLGLIARIRSISSADADANSIVILDGFAKLLSMQVNHGLTDLEKMFTD